mmetsp:Transcript_48470/g.152322  ORF Transcript_48470/g.152322 Transcript_48470/m.152322 type:complete len:210 (+) Transcript_48470:120-749(+)
MPARDGAESPQPECRPLRAVCGGGLQVARAAADRAAPAVPADCVRAGHPVLRRRAPGDGDDARGVRALRRRCARGGPRADQAAHLARGDGAALQGRLHGPVPPRQPRDCVRRQLTPTCVRGAASEHVHHTRLGHASTRHLQPHEGRQADPRLRRGLPPHRDAPRRARLRPVPAPFPQQHLEALSLELRDGLVHPLQDACPLQRVLQRHH